jgi:carbonic anhydrase
VGTREDSSTSQLVARCHRRESVTYEGSLTTPPCSEIVDWMVAMEPIEVAAADVEKFTALYPMNARPALTATAVLSWPRLSGIAPQARAPMR